MTDAPTTIEQVPIGEIKIGQRQRTDYGNIDGLAISIQTYGLLHPIIIDADGHLIAGERRLRAARKLQWSTISATRKEKLNDIERAELELEENVKRHDIDWKDKARAIRDIQVMKEKQHGRRGRGPAAEGKKGDPGWAQQDTAALAGVSTAAVSRAITLADALDGDPTLAKCKNANEAMRKLTQTEAVAVDAEIARRFKASDLVLTNQLKHGDCLVGLRTLEADSVDLVVTDPEYGYGIEDSAAMATHADDLAHLSKPADVLFTLLDQVLRECYRVLKPNRHLFIFYGCEHYERIKGLLTGAGFDVCLWPLIWDKGISVSGTAEGIWHSCSYEPFLQARKGRRKLRDHKNAVYSYPTVPTARRIHETEKPVGLFLEIIEAASEPGELVIDPFAGSAASLEAAMMGGREALGWELDDVRFSKASIRLTTVIERMKGGDA